MSEELKNGANVTEITEQDKALMMWIHQCLLCTIRGILGCFPQVRADKVLMLICLNLGKLVSELYCGDDLAVHRFRKTCRDMFDTTTKQYPVIPLPDGKPKPQTAAIGS